MFATVFFRSWVHLLLLLDFEFTHFHGLQHYRYFNDNWQLFYWVIHLLLLMFTEWVTASYLWVVKRTDCVRRSTWCFLCNSLYTLGWIASNWYFMSQTYYWQKIRSLFDGWTLQFTSSWIRYWSVLQNEKMKHNHLECKFRVQIRYSVSTLWHLQRYDRWRTKKDNIFWASFVRRKSIVMEFVKEQRVGLKTKINK